MDPATTLMAGMPPVGWADVATKRDLDVLRIELDTVKQYFDLRLTSFGNELRAEWRLEMRNLVLAMVATNTTLAALAFGAAQLT